MASFSFVGPGGSDPIEYTLALTRITAPTAGDVVYAAGRQKTRILQRNERGVDVNGSAFPPYSPKYAKKRDKAGRNTEPVDLTFTGLMNKALAVTVNGIQGAPVDTAEVSVFALGFYGKEAERARGHNEGTEKLPKRRFMDASQQDLQTMQNDIGDHIQARLNKL